MVSEERIMKTTGKTKLRFADMPKDYAALFRMHLPRPIHDEVGYKNTLLIAGAFAGFENEMNDDQTDYFDLLCTLLETWEKANVAPLPVGGLNLLKYLVAEHDLNGADLSRILAGSRQLGPMILRGERAITVEHARKLGKRFGLPAGAFIE